MSEQSVYEKRVFYRFQCGPYGEWWHTHGIHTHTDGVDWIEVEEERKNGQEDCHMSDMFVKTDAGWEREDTKFKSSIETYSSAETLKAMIAFLNSHEPPRSEK